MSRAFTKERDDAPESRIDTSRNHPNYMTKQGAAALKKRFARETHPGERERLERSLASAVVVSPPKQKDSVAFGSTVVVAGAGEETDSFTIVGVDEADLELGKIACTSPLAEALLDAHVGERVIWKRPKGNRTLTIMSIS